MYAKIQNYYMNKNQILAALLKIGYEIEKLPASEQATKCSIMVSELSRLIETDGQFPKPNVFEI